MTSINFNKSGSQTLLSLITLSPWADKNKSLVSAFLNRSFPHLYVESISTHSFLDGIKKSMLYGPYGFCSSNTIPAEVRHFAKSISCGYRFLLNVLCKLTDRFFAATGSLLGLLSFIFIEDASACDRNLSPVNLQSRTIGVCDTPERLQISLIGMFDSQCSSSITLSNGILNAASIFSLQFNGLFIGRLVTVQDGISQYKGSGFAKYSKGES